MMGYYESRGMTVPIPREELVTRRVYRIQSRNLSVGAWDEASGGFIGIREKFGSEYLFTEYFRDGVSVTGTATPYRDLNTVIPDEIPLVEYLLDDAGKFIKSDEGFVQINTPLFDLLQPLDEAAREDYAQWWKGTTVEVSETTGGK